MQTFRTNKFSHNNNNNKYTHEYSNKYPLTQSGNLRNGSRLQKNMDEAQTVEYQDHCDKETKQSSISNIIN